MNEFARAGKFLITFVTYALVLAILIGLDVRSPKLAFSLMGIGLLISALAWEVLGGVISAGLATLLTLPFVPLEGPSLLGVAWFGLAAVIVGGGIGWINRRQRLSRPEPKHPRLYPEEVFQKAINPMVIVDPTGRVLERNERAVELLGSVKHLSEFIHFDDLERARAELERALSFGEAGGFELRAVSWDKETLLTEIRIRRLTSDEIWIELHDISDRLELERKLWEAEARYRYLIEDAIDTLDTGILLLDRDKNIIWANQTLGYLFDLDRDEMIGADLKRVLSEVAERMEDELAPSRILEAEEESFVFTLKNGFEERILEFRSIPIETERYRGGRIDHYIDLTEIKKLERELVEKTQRLEESNKKLEEFSYHVSHDLKQPIRTIQAFSQMLLEDYGDKLDDKGVNHLETMQRSSKRMNSLVQNLLKLASIGSKREPLEPVDVRSVLEDVYEDLGALLADVELEFPEEMPTVMANKTRITEVFVNLISNAVKYNDKPVKRVEITYEEEDDEFVFAVCDNGQGIEERYQDRIFELFEQLDPMNDPESTGAGLAICKRIITEMGGRIWVESEVGRGSTFYFSVPKRSPITVVADVHQQA